MIYATFSLSKYFLFHTNPLPELQQFYVYVQLKIQPLETRLDNSENNWLKY